MVLTVLILSNVFRLCRLCFWTPDLITMINVACVYAWKSLLGSSVTVCVGLPWSHGYFDLCQSKWVTVFTDDEQVTQQVALVAQLHTADPHIKESFTMLIRFWQEQQLTLLFTITATTLSLSRERNCSQTRW